MSSSDIDNIFDKASKSKPLLKNRHTLTIDYVPDKLPFRDDETKTLAQVLSTVFKGSRPSNLLLLGDTGTGKTAVVKNVAERLVKKAGELKIQVSISLINAKVASSAYKVLFDIAQQLGINDDEEEKQIPFTGLSMGEATDRILQFIKKKKLHVILVIDEIDSLVARSGDDILYNFSRANQNMKGGFISLIGVSNDLHIADRLDPRVRSSLSEEKMVFNRYTVDQLRQILHQRASLAFYDNAISDAIINLCSAMAGREHGDARKAIDLLRVSAELAEREGADRVTENHVRIAQEKIEKDPDYDYLKNAPMHKKLIVLAIAKSKDGQTGGVYNAYSSLCKKTAQEPLTQRRFTQIIKELKEARLVIVEDLNLGRYGNSQKITVTIPLNVVKEALKDDPTFLPLID